MQPDLTLNGMKIFAAIGDSIRETCAKSREPMGSTTKQSPVSAWQVHDSIEVRAARDHEGGLGEILAMVPDMPPMPGDEV